MANFEKITVRAYVRGGENCHSFDDINLIEEFSRIDVEKLFVSNRRNRNKFIHKLLNKLENFKGWFEETDCDILRTGYESWEYGWYGHLTYEASEIIECLIDMDYTDKRLVEYINFFEPYEEKFLRN